MITLTVWVNVFLMVASLNFVSFFSRTLLAVCVLIESVSHLGKKSSSFALIIVSTYLLVLIFTLEELSLICSYLIKVSCKSHKNANCVMIVVFVLRWWATFKSKQMKGWQLMIKHGTLKISFVTTNDSQVQSQGKKQLSKRSRWKDSWNFS